MYKWVTVQVKNTWDARLPGENRRVILISSVLRKWGRMDISIQYDIRYQTKVLPKNKKK